MLSAPVKSAKRISSLFSLSSNNKDATSPSSPRSPGLPPDQQPPPQDRRRRSSSRPARLSSAPVPNFSHPSPSPMADNFDLDSPLPPPPSLLSVNQDLADNASTSSDRPQSRGRRLSSSNRPSSSGGLAVPGGPDSRPGTPSKRRSWMPGRARASSIDVRSSPQLPSAWIAGLEHKIIYDMAPLGRGEQVRKLCYAS
ncbi:uncharacterized protein BDV14DRAFT_44561 [Aspergillus stella-maris]|uniref:uncharacterized protein n=1 Tax=Aspergillus stella-maris TaxID=1810926 RepID=UPI003CCCC004